MQQNAPDQPHHPQKKKLTDKQRRFVGEYLDPESPGYLNASQAYQQAFPNTPKEYAHKYAHIMRHRPAVQNVIQETLERHGFGIDRRLQALAEIGNGVALSEKEVVTKSGQIVTISVRPSMRERLQAVEIANKVDGTYNQQKLDLELARDEAADLRRRILKAVS